MSTAGAVRWHQDLVDVAMRLGKEIKFGETCINRENFEATQGFHAGWRTSGIGRADGRHGVHENTRTRMVAIQHDTAAGSRCPHLDTTLVPAGPFGGDEAPSGLSSVTSRRE